MQTPRIDSSWTRLRFCVSFWLKTSDLIFHSCFEKFTNKKTLWPTFHPSSCCCLWTGQCVSHHSFTVSQRENPEYSQILLWGLWSSCHANGWQTEKQKLKPFQSEVVDIWFRFLSFVLNLEAAFTSNVIHTSGASTLSPCTDLIRGPALWFKSQAWRSGGSMQRQKFTKVQIFQLWRMSCVTSTNRELNDELVIWISRLSQTPTWKRIWSVFCRTLFGFFSMETKKNTSSSFIIFIFACSD